MPLGSQTASQAKNLVLNSSRNGQAVWANHSDAQHAAAMRRVGTTLTVTVHPTTVGPADSPTTVGS